MGKNLDGHVGMDRENADRYITASQRRRTYSSGI